MEMLSSLWADKHVFCLGVNYCRHLVVALALITYTQLHRVNWLRCFVKRRKNL